MADYFISQQQAEGDMLAAAAFLAERIKSSDGRAEAMKSIVPIYLERGEVDLSAELANQIDDPHTRDRLLTQIAVKCAEIDDDDYAIQLAETIEDHGLRSQAFEEVAHIKASKKQFEKAREIATMMNHPDFIYAGIAVNQAASGEASAADATLDEIEFPTARVAALQQIAAAQIKSGDVASAVEMLENAITEADEIEHSEEKIRALIEIGGFFVETKRNDRAIETIEAARSQAVTLDNIHRDYLLVGCAIGFLHAGSEDLADRTLDLVTDKTQISSAMLEFARDEWRRENKSDAVEVLDEAYEILKSQRDIETRDSRARNALMASIATQFAGFGKTERGIEIAQENQDSDEQMSGLSQIAQILTLQKEDELARQTLNLIPDEASRAFCLISIADAKQKHGDTYAAISLLDEAASLAKTAPQLALCSGALTEIAERLIGLDRPEKAREISLENLAIISQIRDESSQAAALAALSQLYESSKLNLSDAEVNELGKLTQALNW